MTFPNTTGAGIYAIRNTDNGKVYVGKTRHFITRWREHRRRLRAGRHTNAHLQSAWIKYGEGTFSFEVLEILSPDKPQLIAEREGYWVEKFRAMDRATGYNLDVVSPFGTVTASPETRLRLRNSHLGKKQSPEAIAKTAAAHRGMKRSSITIARLRAANSGQKMTKEQCVKLSKAKINKPLSKAHRAAIQVAHRNTTITAANRRAIADRSKAGELRTELAREFGVSLSYISMIKRGQIIDRRGKGRTLHLVDGEWITRSSFQGPELSVTGGTTP